MSPTQKLKDAVMALPPRSRARLAESLLASLDDPRQKELDALWAEEAESRIEAYEAGKLRAISGREVFRTLKAKRR